MTKTKITSLVSPCCLHSGLPQTPYLSRANIFVTWQLGVEEKKLSTARDFFFSKLKKKPSSELRQSLRNSCSCIWDPTPVSTVRSESHHSFRSFFELQYEGLFSGVSVQGVLSQILVIWAYFSFTVLLWESCKTCFSEEFGFLLI